MVWLIVVRVNDKNLTLIHYISFTQDQLCTGLATDRIYVHWDINLKKPII